MREAFICEGARTPVGRYGGSLSAVRPDDLLAHAMKAALAKAPGLPAEKIDEVYAGCANQAGEDNRNVARMALLLAGLPDSVPASTVNRLCGSGLDAVGLAARAIKAGEADVVLAGGVEIDVARALRAWARRRKPSRATPRSTTRRSAGASSIPLMKAQYGIDSMPETAENVAEEFQVARADQDAFALRSQKRAAAAQKNGRLAQRDRACGRSKAAKATVTIVERDEHPRETTLDKLASVPAPFRKGGSVTAGNASGVNDGAAAMIIASREAVDKYGLKPLAKISALATAGVAPRIMGYRPRAGNAAADGSGSA